MGALSLGLLWALPAQLAGGWLPCGSGFAGSGSTSRCRDANRAVADTKHIAESIERGSQVSAALPDVKRGSHI